MFPEENTKPEKKVQKKPTRFIFALFVLINSALGDGLFGSALAYAKSGLIGGLIIQVIVMFFAYLTFYFLIDVADLLGVYSFGDV